MSKIEFKQDYYVYTPKTQGIYPIQEIDWDRLKSLIHKIIPEKKLYSTFSSLLLGVFISSVFSIISLNILENLPDWILPTNWIICISSLLIGIALIIIDNQQKEILKLTSQFILDEMVKIEEQYDKQDNTTKNDVQKQQ